MATTESKHPLDEPTSGQVIHQLRFELQTEKVAHEETKKKLTYMQRTHTLCEAQRDAYHDIAENMIDKLLSKVESR